MASGSFSLTKAEISSNSQVPLESVFLTTSSVPFLASRQTLAPSKGKPDETETQKTFILLSTSFL